MKKISLYCTVLFLFNSCNKEKLFDGPNYYADDFDQYNAVSELTSTEIAEDLRWSLQQITDPTNNLVLDNEVYNSAPHSIKFSATPSGSNVSKCSLMKQNMAFWEDETVRFEASYFIAGNQTLNWLFLCDIEERTAIGAGPGMRLALVENKLRFEYKFNEDDILQNTGIVLDFPRNQWVDIVWEIKLSQKKKGSVKLWQNDTLIIDASDKVTLPSDILYFQQGTKGMYSSIEIGITANSTAYPLELWVDDFEISAVKN